ncbi:UbiX family flavin prenyltransferase [Rubrobacter naiadicus]|uniref:UbiX family flavin prenyltransferase n=1 Tax=Rubrobacter naiadicus TaxID=1392641 RepID=UPI002362ACB8|nr:UbiX family flavin prenyltransferase [Rubrobacter naiadicus]
MAVSSAFVGITGASGAPYAVRLIEVLTASNIYTEICASEMGEKVLAYEMRGMSTRKLAERYGAKRYAPDDLFAPPASGTSTPDATVIAPASVSTLAKVATGAGSNLIHRVADVTLKERKRLILLEREMPYSLVHLRNMTSVTEAGAVVISAAPGFYNHPESLENIVDFVVGKVLDVMGVEHELTERWGHKRRKEMRS